MKVSAIALFYFAAIGTPCCWVICCDDGAKMKPSLPILVIFLVVAGCLSAGWVELWMAIADVVLSNFDIDIHVGSFHKSTVALFGMLSAFSIWKYGLVPLQSKRIRNLVVTVVVIWIFVFFFPGVIGALIFLDRFISKENMEKAIAAVVCFVLACIGIWICWRNLNKVRHASDTPTSKIRSAAQGYVELKGRIKSVQGQIPLLAPYSHTFCLWWECEIWLRRSMAARIFTKEEWTRLEKKCSHDGFALADETGECQINPEGAHIIEHEKNEWHGSARHPAPGSPRDDKERNDRYRYRERLLLPMREIYALGDFRSKNGQHLLAAPDDGRPFVLSGESEGEVIGEAHFNAILGAILCLAGIIGATFLAWRLWQ